MCNTRLAHTNNTQIHNSDKSEFHIKKHKKDFKN